MRTTLDPRRIRVVQEAAHQISGAIEILLASGVIETGEHGSTVCSLLRRMIDINAVTMDALDAQNDDVERMEETVFGSVQPEVELAV